MTVGTTLLTTVVGAISAALGVLAERSPRNGRKIATGCVTRNSPPIETCSATTPAHHGINGLTNPERLGLRLGVAGAQPSCLQAW